MASAICMIIAIICTFTAATQSSNSLHGKPSPDTPIIEKRAVTNKRFSDATSSTALQIPEFDLDGEFVRGALSDNLKQALDIIGTTETLPSCGKIATSALLHSCSGLEGFINHNSDLPPGSDLMIEEESDIYAARLAVCELSGADFPVPTACRSFIPSAGGKKTQVLRGWLSSKGPTWPKIANDYYDEVTEANLKQCRKALGSSGQAWTSYSNSRQNAVAMCHAMQSAVERDESRHIAQILANTAAATTESLQDAFEQVNVIKRQFHDLTTAMPKFQKDLAAFDNDVQERVQRFWDQLETQVQSLATFADQAQTGMKEARDHLDAVLSSHLPELAAAIAKARQDVGDAADKAAASRDLVVFAKQRIEQDLIAQMDTAGYGLAAINDLMPQLSNVIERTINNTLGFYDAATARQLEFNEAQQLAVDGLDRINKTAASANSLLEELFSTLLSTQKLWAPALRFLRAILLMICAVILEAMAFIFWRYWASLSLLSSIVTSIASTIRKF